MVVSGTSEGEHTMVIRAGEMVLVMLAPALFFGTVLEAPRCLRAVCARIGNRRAGSHPEPLGRPIERVAADLRRLLWEHHRFTRSDQYPLRAQRMWALETAIADCAHEAARALRVPVPARPAGEFGRPQLRGLLRALAAEGLVLPAAVELLSPGGGR
jgi:hypothetical protein